MKLPWKWKLSFELHPKVEIGLRSEKYEELENHLTSNGM